MFTGITLHFSLHWNIYIRVAVAVMQDSYNENLRLHTRNKHFGICVLIMYVTLLAHVWLHCRIMWPKLGLTVLKTLEKRSTHSTHKLTNGAHGERLCRLLHLKLLIAKRQGFLTLHILQSL